MATILETTALAVRPTSITVKIVLPRTPLSPEKLDALLEALEGFFWQVPVIINGIITLGLDAWGNADRSQARFQQFVFQCRMNFCPALRFAIELEY